MRVEIKRKVKGEILDWRLEGKIPIKEKVEFYFSRGEFFKPFFGVEYFNPFKSGDWDKAEKKITKLADRVLEGKERKDYAEQYLEREKKELQKLLPYWKNMLDSIIGGCYKKYSDEKSELLSFDLPHIKGRIQTEWRQISLSAAAVNELIKEAQERIGLEGQKPGEHSTLEKAVIASFPKFGEHYKDLLDNKIFTKNEDGTLKRSVTQNALALYFGKIALNPKSINWPAVESLFRETNLAQAYFNVKERERPPSDFLKIQRLLKFIKIY